MPLQHEHTLNPVTALTFYCSETGKKLLFAGEGAFLKIFEVETSRLLLRCHAFETQIIHGISVEDSGLSQNDLRVVIWGGSSFVLLTKHDIDLIFTQELTSLVQREQIAPDWLLDGAISKSPGLGSCVFVTAHSAALHVSCTDELARHHLKQLSSPSRSILYSASITWTSTSSFMVAAGTMFGEIEVIIWNLNHDAGRKISTFTGHEGSVFGVSISPEVLDLNGSPVRLLASCSDDRTVRVWKVGIISNEVDVVESDVDSETLIRETGFGSNFNTSQTLTSDSSLVAAKMGHISRIWGVRFLLPVKTSPLTYEDVSVLSFGEDATVHQWKLDNKTTRPTMVASGTHSQNQPKENQNCSLNLVNVSAYHSGKHIWSSTLFCDNRVFSQLATGGADGKVSLYDVYFDHYGDKAISGDRIPSSRSSIHQLEEKICPRRKIISGNWPLEAIIHNSLSYPGSPEATNYSPTKPISTFVVTADSTTTRVETKDATDMLNHYAFVTADSLLVATTSGRLLLANLESLERQQTWRELQFLDTLRPSSKINWMLKGIPEKQLAFMATINNGIIYIVSQGGDYIAEVTRIQGKIAGIFNLSKASDTTLQILVTTVGRDKAVILSVDVTSSEHSILKSKRMMTLPPKFVLTAASNIAGILILGSREGNLTFYCQDEEEGTSPRLVYTQNLQTRESVRSIVNIPSRNSGTLPYFLITARDGTYCVFSLLGRSDASEQWNSNSICLVHRGSPPFGPGIEAAWFEDSSLYLYGFRSKTFVVWNETKQMEVMSVDCGGAHRTYAYSPRSGSGGAGHLAFTKAGQLNIHSQNGPLHKVIKKGGHGREMKACAVLPEKGLLATGAEDTNIRLWRYDTTNASSRDGSYECCAIIEKHVTGLQDLQWSYLEDRYTYLFSAAAYEEFHVWEISEVPGFGLGVACEATLDDVSEDRDLRIMAFDTLPISMLGQGHHDAKQTEALDNAHLVCLAFSDSTIKTYLYSKRTEFRKICDGRYTSSCLTQLKIIPPMTTIQDSIYNLLTASTDGHLALWKFPFSIHSSPAEEHLLLLSRISTHQSSIQALDILYISDIVNEENDTVLEHSSNPASFIVASAGDDNSLAITLFEHSWNETGTGYDPMEGGAGAGITRVLIPSAHAAAITGVAFLPSTPNTHTSNNSRSGPEQQRRRQYSLCTVGNDQKVKRWRIELALALEDNEEQQNAVHSVPGGKITISVLPIEDGDEIGTAVADAAGLVVLDTSAAATAGTTIRADLEKDEREIELERQEEKDKCQVLVFGNGFETFSVSET